MTTPLWADNLDRLRESLLAQLGRIRSGSSHSTIKGGSLEAVVRRTLGDYLPGYFGIGSGQAANQRHEISPQIDVLVYDKAVFPHLTVNEDSSVVVCCEALYGAIECKTAWDRDRVRDHFARFAAVESVRNDEYAGVSNAAAYYVLVFDDVALSSGTLSEFADSGRFVGIYTVAGNRAWTSVPASADFAERTGNALSLLLSDLLGDCMEKGQKDVDALTRAYAALRRYLGP